MADPTTPPLPAVPGPAGDDVGEDWDGRDAEVIELAYAIAIDELKESLKPFEQAKTRAAVVFGSTSAAMAFLVGSAIRDLDRDSLNDVLLYCGVGSFVLFGLLTLVMLFPWSRDLYLDGLDVRNRFVLGHQPEDKLGPGHALDVAGVRSYLIALASQKVDRNLRRLHLLRWVFVGMLVSAAATITFWSLVVAYGKPPA